MCCRFWMEESPEMYAITERLNRSPLTGKMERLFGKPPKTAGEVFPTDIVPVIAPSRTGAAEVFPMRWGFSNLRAGQPLINCRAETAGGKPLWKEAWNKRRCAIPFSWYYEWRHFIQPDGKRKTGEKYRIQPMGANLSYFAGLYRIEEKDGTVYPVFSVLTREPWEGIRFIHDRMPVIFAKEQVRAWIAPDTAPEELVKKAVDEMVYEDPDSLISPEGRQEAE